MPCLAQWHVEPIELKKMWVATMMSINYRLPFDVGEKIAAAKGDLTVKVTFTDYIFGKVFTEQIRNQTRLIPPALQLSLAEAISPI